MNGATDQDDELRGGEAYCATCAAPVPRETERCAKDGTELMIRWRPPGDPSAGVTLGGKFRIVERIAEGGMGIVYSGSSSRSIAPSRSR